MTRSSLSPSSGCSMADHQPEADPHCHHHGGLSRHLAALAVLAAPHRRCARGTTTATNGDRRRGRVCGPDGCRRDRHQRRPRHALGSFFDAATGAFSQMALAILTLGVAVALSAWLAGPSSSARRSRVATGDTARVARVLGERRGISTGRVGEWADAHHSGVLLALLVLQLVRTPAVAEPAPAVLIEQEHDRHA